MISKDEIKEEIFKSIGYSNREFSKKVGKASWEILYLMAEQFLKTKSSFILESNFNPKSDDQKLKKILTSKKFKLIQVLCFADGQILADRFRKRAVNGKRHPGHVDDSNFEEFEKELLKGKAGKLNLEAKLIEIDTTDFKKVDYQELFKKIKSK